MGFLREADDDPRMAVDGVSAVVVTFRNAAHIEACAAALREAAPAVPMELIVVDNDSGDGTAGLARKIAPDARVLESGRNGGFAFGCHAGADVARGRWLLFLNPDALPAPGSVDALLDCARSVPRAGIVGGHCVRADGSDDPRSWWRRPTLWSLFCFATLLSTAFPGGRFDPEVPLPWSEEGTEIRGVPIVTGGFMLVAREAWEATGGFDRAFFMYAEDADLCLRAAAAGYRPHVTGRAVFQHEVGASSDPARKQLLLFTGKATLVRRHFPRGTRWLGVRLLMLGVLGRALLGRVLTARPERQGRATTGGDAWRALWAARREWTGGWTA
ncbi:glycosyltransferase [Actinomadura sp. J1-007]|nr:glycosyltransferase [Actinomadura sp. J1-007]